MGNGKQKKFVPLLERMSKDGDETVADAARWALGKLADSSTESS
jgi:hypothetical protein